MTTATELAQQAREAFDKSEYANRHVMFLKVWMAAWRAALDAATEAQRQMEQKAFAFDEWIEKTNWVQEQINTFPLSTLGKHRADVMRNEIERLRVSYTVIRNAALDEAAKEADHWKDISQPGHVCGQYIGAAIRGLKREGE
jgi:hypothetical protein